MQKKYTYTTNNIRRAFIEACYDGNRKAYLEARRKDLVAVKEQFAYFKDALRKDGQISERTWFCACI